MGGLFPETDLSDTDNIAPYENTIPITPINLLCILMYSGGVAKCPLNFLGIITPLPVYLLLSYLSSGILHV